MVSRLPVLLGQRASVSHLATPTFRFSSTLSRGIRSPGHSILTAMRLQPARLMASSSAGSGTSPVATALVGTGALATVGGGITLYYAHESEAFRESLREAAPFLGPVWDLVTPAPKPEPRPLPPPPPRAPTPPPVTRPARPEPAKPKAAEESKKEEKKPEKSAPKKETSEEKENKSTSSTQDTSRPHSPESIAATYHFTPFTPSVGGEGVGTHPPSPSSSSSTTAASGERTARVEAVEGALFAGIDSPTVPAAITHTRTPPATTHAPSPSPSSSPSPPSPSPSSGSREEEVSVIEQKNVAESVSREEQNQASNASISSEPTKASSESEHAPAPTPTPTVVSAVAPSANHEEVVANNSDANASPSVPLDVADAGVAAAATAGAAAGVVVGAMMATGEESVAMLNQTQAMLLQAEHRVQELERQLQMQTTGEIRRREAQREADALAHQHALNDERVKAKEQLASEVASVRADYEKILAAEVTTVREHYLKELQSHLQVQQKIHEQDLAEKSVELTKKIKEESESDLNLRVGRERAARLALLETHFQRLKAVEGILASRADLEATMGHTAALTAAAAGLRVALETAQPLRPQVEVLLAACGASDELVPTLLATIPPSALDTGVAPIAESILRFPTLKTTIRRVALVPDNGTLVDHVLAWAASAITFEKHGLVPGDDVEAVLARAEHYVNASDIESAARELAQLSGTAGRVAADWVRQVRTRLETTQAVALLGAYVDLQNLTVV